MNVQNDRRKFINRANNIYIASVASHSCTNVVAGSNVEKDFFFKPFRVNLYNYRNTKTPFYINQ
jgi:hypothetical protein